MMEVHVCEPKLDELKSIRKSLYASESTNKNVKKIKAIEAQIARHEAAAEAKKAEAKKVAEIKEAAEKTAAKRDEEKARKGRKARD